MSEENSPESPFYNQQEKEGITEEIGESDGQTQIEEEPRVPSSEATDPNEEESGMQPSEEQIEEADLNGEDDQVQTEHEDTRISSSEAMGPTEEDEEEKPPSDLHQSEEQEEDALNGEEIQDQKELDDSRIPSHETEESTENDEGRPEQVEEETSKEEENEGQADLEEKRETPTDVTGPSTEGVEEEEDKKNVADISDNTGNVANAEKVKDKPVTVPKSVPKAASTTKSGVSKIGSSYAGIVPAARTGSRIKVHESVNEKVASLRCEEVNSVKWICAKFEDGDTKKQLIITDESGDDAGIKGLGDVLKENEAACVFLRLFDSVDDIANVKFVYILWIGEDMPGLKKGRMVTYRGELEKLFEPFHVYIHATHHADVDPKAIENKLGAASGSKSNVI